MSEAKKRFIAGAVCPACSEMDRIKMWDVDGVPHRECVACGYADTLNAQGQSVPSRCLCAQLLADVTDKGRLGFDFCPTARCFRLPIDDPVRSTVEQCLVML